MRYISLFSGIEAASVAWRDLGWEPVAFCEIDRFPSAVLAHHFPNVPNLGDITKVDWKEVLAEHGAIDLIVGGSPCQSFSIAAGANRTSLDGKSNLMLEWIRAVEIVRPKWVLWENVPGALNTKDDAFGCLLRALQEIGYLDCSWRVLDARFFGVPQRRRRIFLVGHLGEGFNSAAVLFDSASMQRIAQAREEWRQANTDEVGAGADETICMADDTSKAAINIGLAGTLLAGGALNDIAGRLCSHYSKGFDTLAIESQVILCVTR